MPRHAVTIALLLIATTASAREPISDDFRCLTTAGPNPIQLEFRMFSDPNSKWTGGYIKYRKSKAVIPLVLKSTEATDKPEGRPCDFTDTWVEVSDGEITGEYEVAHQAALINSFVYRSRKTGKEYSFAEVDGPRGDDACAWN